MCAKLFFPLFSERLTPEECLRHQWLKSLEEPPKKMCKKLELEPVPVIESSQSNSNSLLSHTDTDLSNSSQELIIDAKLDIRLSTNNNPLEPNLVQSSVTSQNQNEKMEFYNTTGIDIDENKNFEYKNENEAQLDNSPSQISPPKTAQEDKHLQEIFLDTKDIVSKELKNNEENIFNLNKLDNVPDTNGVENIPEDNANNYIVSQELRNDEEHICNNINESDKYSTINNLENAPEDKFHSEHLEICENKNLIEQKQNFVENSHSSMNKNEKQEEDIEDFEKQELERTKDNLKEFVKRWNSHPNSPYVIGSPRLSQVICVLSDDVRSHSSLTSMNVAPPSTINIIDCENELDDLEDFMLRDNQLRQAPRFSLISQEMAQELEQRLENLQAKQSDEEFVPINITEVISTPPKPNETTILSEPEPVESKRSQKDVPKEENKRDACDLSETKLNLQTNSNFDETSPQKEKSRRDTCNQELSAFSQIEIDKEKQNHTNKTPSNIINTCDNREITKESHDLVHKTDVVGELDKSLRIQNQEVSEDGDTSESGQTSTLNKKLEQPSIIKIDPHQKYIPSTHTPNVSKNVEEIPSEIARNETGKDTIRKLTDKENIKHRPSRDVFIQPGKKDLFDKESQMMFSDVSLSPVSTPGKRSRKHSRDRDDHPPSRDSDRATPIRVRRRPSRDVSLSISQTDKLNSLSKSDRKSTLDLWPDMICLSKDEADSSENESSYEPITAKLELPVKVTSNLQPNVSGSSNHVLSSQNQESQIKKSKSLDCPPTISSEAKTVTWMLDLENAKLPYISQQSMINNRVENQKAIDNNINESSLRSSPNKSIDYLESPKGASKHQPINSGKEGAPIENLTIQTPWGPMKKASYPTIKSVDNSTIINISDCVINITKAKCEKGSGNEQLDIKLAPSTKTEARLYEPRNERSSAERKRRLIEKYKQDNVQIAQPETQEKNINRAQEEQTRNEHPYSLSSCESAGKYSSHIPNNFKTHTALMNFQNELESKNLNQKPTVKVKKKDLSPEKVPTESPHFINNSIESYGTLTHIPTKVEKLPLSINTLDPKELKQTEQQKYHLNVNKDTRCNEGKSNLNEDFCKKENFREDSKFTQTKPNTLEDNNKLSHSIIHKKILLQTDSNQGKINEINSISNKENQCKHFPIVIPIKSTQNNTDSKISKPEMERSLNCSNTNAHTFKKTLETEFLQNSLASAHCKISEDATQSNNKHAKEDENVLKTTNFHPQNNSTKDKYFSSNKKDSNSLLQEHESNKGSEKPSQNVTNKNKLCNSQSNFKKSTSQNSDQTAHSIKDKGTEFKNKICANLIAKDGNMRTREDVEAGDKCISQSAGDLKSTLCHSSVSEKKGKGGTFEPRFVIEENSQQGVPRKNLKESKNACEAESKLTAKSQNDALSSILEKCLSGDKTKLTTFPSSSTMNQEKSRFYQTLKPPSDTTRSSTPEKNLSDFEAETANNLREKNKGSNNCPQTSKKPVSCMLFTARDRIMQFEQKSDDPIEKRTQKPISRSKTNTHFDENQPQVDAKSKVNRSSYCEKPSNASSIVYRKSNLSNIEFMRNRLMHKAYSITSLSNNIPNASDFYNPFERAQSTHYLPAN